MLTSFSEFGDHPTEPYRTIFMVEDPETGARQVIDVIAYGPDATEWADLYTRDKYMAHQFRDTFCERMTKVMDLPNEGWVLGWEWALFVLIKDNKAVMATGLEHATVYPTREAALAVGPVTNGARVVALPMMMKTAKHIAEKALREAIVAINPGLGVNN